MILGGLSACSSPEVPGPEPAADDSVPQLEAPAANGPKLVALAHGVVVRDRPSVSGQPLGFLRAGATIARATQPYSKRGCEGGWYPVRPRGFVCVGPDVTLDTSAAIGRVLGSRPPDLDRPLPYRYGRVGRGTAVVYSTLPTADEQRAAEPELRDRKPREPVALGTGSNDVPLDDHGLPAGPPILLPDAQGVGADGRRTSETCFVFPGMEGPPEPLTRGGSLVGPSVPKTQVLKQDSGVGLVGSFTWDTGEGTRRFGVLPDGRFIAIDRLRPALGSSWHGVDLNKTGLPLGFVLREGVSPYQLERNKATRVDGEELEPRQAVWLTGRFRTVDSIQYYFTSDNQWVRHRDIILIYKRQSFPDFVADDVKWLDVSLANQTLVAYDGKVPVYATLISSGSDRLGDPSAGPATIQGTFRLRSKHVTAHVDDREVSQAFSVLDAPWVAVFSDGFALTGSYWLHDFGEAESYHNIALSPVDAHWLWLWSDPQLPEGWHGVVAGDSGPTTIVLVHK